MTFKQLMLLAFLLTTAAACKSKKNGHSHGGGHEHGEHGHSHGPQRPVEARTLWTDSSELFVEWDALVVGMPSTMRAHVTDIRNPNGFVTYEEAKMELVINIGGADMAPLAPTRAQPGIFIYEISVDQPGPCTMRFELSSGAHKESVAFGSCQAFASAQAAMDAAPEEGADNSIAMLKETQWTIPFANAPVRKERIVPSTTINATIKAVPSLEARLTAGTGGRVSLSQPAPTLGTQVEAGQLLARIQPTVAVQGNIGSLRADLATANAELKAAEVDAERIKRLVESDSIPKKRLSEALTQVEIARARKSAAATRLQSYQSSASGSARPNAGAFQVKSPIAGTIVERAVTEGETISAGSELFHVIDLDRVWVEGRVFESDVPAFEDSKDAWFKIDGRDKSFEINSETGRLVTIGHVLDPKTRTVPVIFEIKNPDRHLRIGQYAKLSVATGEARQSLAIPESAVLQDGNQQITFVQTGGESFERRVLQVGNRSRGFVEVRDGVKEGERVVTVGAYDVKLTTAGGGAAAHGHVH